MPRIYKTRLSNGYLVECATYDDSPRRLDHNGNKYINLTVRDIQNKIVREFQHIQMAKEKSHNNALYYGTGIVSLPDNRFAVATSSESKQIDYTNTILIFNANDGTLETSFPIASGEEQIIQNIVSHEENITVGIDSCFYTYHSKSGEKINTAYAAGTLVTLAVLKNGHIIFGDFNDEHPDQSIGIYDKKNGTVTYLDTPGVQHGSDMIALSNDHVACSVLNSEDAVIHIYNPEDGSLTAKIPNFMPLYNNIKMMAALSDNKFVVAFSDEYEETDSTNIVVFDLNSPANNNYHLYLTGIKEYFKNPSALFEYMVSQDQMMLSVVLNAFTPEAYPGFSSSLIGLIGSYLCDFLPQKETTMFFAQPCANKDAKALAKFAAAGKDFCSSIRSNSTENLSGELKDDKVRLGRA